MTKSQKTILLVDDNPSFLMYVGILVKRFGYSVFIANNGAEALRIMKEKRPSLVFLDITMPVMDGKTCLDFAKHDPEIKDIPVFMLTARFDNIVQDCIKIGCKGYLKKPINPTELYETIQNTVEETPRQNLRTNISLKVNLSCEDKEEDLYANTLSEDGIYIRRENPIEIGTPVVIRLPIPSSLEPITVRGSVIYTNTLKDDLSTEPGMGVRFIDVSPEVRSRLRRIIYDQLVKDLIEGKEEILKD
jgi:uncharacterized protein (TIGR02266 family)